MKLIIYTQCMENYGAHDWDGKGSCPQYWKAKGGNTYVVRNLTRKQCEKISESGIPTLTELLTESNDGFREYVISWGVFEDNAWECEEWDTPIHLYYNVTAGQWRAHRVIKNDEHGYMAPEIREKIERWTLGQGGKNLNYLTYYRLYTGKLVSFDELEQYLADRAAAKEVDTVS